MEIEQNNNGYWDILEVTENVKMHNRNNAYLRNLKDISSLRGLQEKKVRNAMNANSRDLSLTNLFITASFLRRMLTWTNNYLKSNGKNKISFEKFRAFLGLELAMCLIKMISISDYWSTKLFAGQEDFKKTMSRNDFCSKRAALQFHPPVDNVNNHFIALTNPLWHSRSFLHEFDKNCSKVAVPAGCSALDKNSAGASARSHAISYIPSKPDKYAVRFYSVVASSVYCSSMWNNGSGNTTGICPAQTFCAVFPAMRAAYNKGFLHDDIVDPASPTAL